MAKLYFKHGPMTCSKSALLLMTAHSFSERGIPFLCFKPSVDTREGKDVIKSRIGLSRKCITLDQYDDIFYIMEQYCMRMDMEYQPRPMWLLVDEAQFLTEKQVEGLGMVVDELGIDVICYGLRTDFQTRLFPGSKRLIELADDIEEMKITCKCGRKVIINARVDEDGNVIREGLQVVIGDEMYVPMCRKCYNNALKEK